MAENKTIPGYHFGEHGCGQIQSGPLAGFPIRWYEVDHGRFQSQILTSGGWQCLFGEPLPLDKANAALDVMFPASAIAP